ncbi:class I SAM-dependent rRNA methyltransferase [Aestuariibacter salexigens]|uniref:class I SAM-dependent rRNA methyltransferase n=1 Tax=Aestuariibacter salexigens TaxID=226010 RepID=UPI00041B3A8D|nr:class I SAM-dependent methyltransferase [Aestuariibacter salexigens]
MSAVITLHPGRDKSLRRHHPWIFASAVSEVKGKARSGDTVDVLDSEGQWLARGAYSPDSQIRVRVWTFDQSQVIDNGFFIQAIEQARMVRQPVIEQSQCNGYRLVAGESDNLPGITIDVYGDVIVCQLLSAGAEKHRKKIVWALSKCFADATIVERSDVAVREKEGLQQLTQILHGESPEPVVIRENGINIKVDVLQGHKTGFYLDQRDNRLAVAQYCKDKDVLNCFSYTGTFSLYALVHGAKHVTNLDVSDVALRTAEENLALNNIDAQRCTQINADVFEKLREYRDQQRQFDVIVLDPPKFVDSKASLNRASRGYKDINMLALQLLKPNGILCTFSCSGLMSADLFQKIVADAALDAKRQVRILQKLTQAKDHPILASYPEGFYLKGLICHVS